MQRKRERNSETDSYSSSGGRYRYQYESSETESSVTATPVKPALVNSVVSPLAETPEDRSEGWLRVNARCEAPQPNKPGCSADHELVCGHTATRPPSKKAAVRDSRTNLVKCVCE